MKTYRVIITKNRKKKKLVFETNVKKNATQRFNKLIRNNKILFPVRFISNKNPMEVNFELLLMKKRSSKTDTSLTLRDTMGRTQKPIFNNDDWVLIKHKPYDYEESFKVHGFDERLCLIDVISKIINPLLNKNKKDTGHVYRFHNKICIEVGGSVNLIVTKNRYDSIRAYDKLKDLYLRKKSLRILFSGEVPKSKRSGLYTRLGSSLGIDRDYLWRSMTR
jgi:hypothetical protein|tara:strand:+ start:1585 stop:2244 length:660 start_codon:yes stop_codon:yes gene_type:complete